MGAQEKSPNASSSMQRVKVYRLNEDGKWDDQGTGHVSFDYMERSEDLGLFVIDEDDSETLLLHRISSDDIYHKQEDTIISWRDPEFSTELALSFQETAGCSYIWLVSDMFYTYHLVLPFTCYLISVFNLPHFGSHVCSFRDHICSAQRNMHFSSLADETYHNTDSKLRELPSVELSTLPLILKTVVESGIADQNHMTELILHDQDFFRKLMELFRMCEDVENTDGLRLIFKIIRGIILLNSPQIFERIFGDELIMDIIGCFEYNPEVPRVQHRKFLEEQVVFKEAIPIKDPVVRSKIHQTYRVSYLKDVIWPRVLDEAIAANFCSIIHSNNAIVVSLLKDDNTFIKELFSKLRSPTTEIETKKTLVHFLHEFCTLSKSLQMAHQLRLFRDLVSEGIFEIVADVLQSEDKKLVLTGTDILILFLNQDPNILRGYVSQQEGILFGLLVKNMLTDFGDDMHCQFVEILRSLLDSYTSGSQRDTIVEIFYEKHLGQIIDVITSSCPPNSAGEISSKCTGSDGGPRNQSHLKPEILLSICDLLCFCVLHHPYRIKCNFLLNNVIDKILYLTRRREKYLIIAAVRFVRTLVSRNDEHLMNHFVKNNLFKPIVDAFVANGDRYNILNSSVLELFEYIRKENLKILLRYVVDTFWDELVKFKGLSSIQTLKVKYEQSLESVGTSSNGDLLDQRKRTEERALEKEEEDYFNEGSDEEDSASAQITSAERFKIQASVVVNGSAPCYPSLRSGGLVDYDDDEEDYRPPPRNMTDASNEDEGVMEFPLKRKLVSKEEPQSKRLQRSPNNLKPGEGVFTALCSTLSQVVLPSKKTGTIAINISQLDVNKNSTEPNHEEGGYTKSSGNCQNVDLENHTDTEEASCRSFSDSLHDSSDNRQRGDDLPLLQSKSSPEMAVNGS